MDLLDAVLGSDAGLLGGGFSEELSTSPGFSIPHSPALFLSFPTCKMEVLILPCRDASGLI